MIRTQRLPSLQDDAELPDADSLDLALFRPRARPDGVRALTHCRALTMTDRDHPGAVVDDATIVVDGDRIRSVEALEDGPRVYSTGFILYGALDSPLDDIEASTHIRTVLVGGRVVP